MALDERARHELFLRLEAALGPKSAETLMELLPPVGWADVATKRDLDALEHKLLAAFRGEQLVAIRTIVIANIGAVLSTAALAFSAAKLS